MPSADRTAVIDADFYLLEQSLEPEGRQLLHRVREFMEKSVQPVINHYWTREEFPHDLLPGLRQLGIAGLAYTGYGCPGGGNLLDGMIAMELARVDPSIGTFFGVHSGLAMGSVYLCGSPEQKERWLPEMARMEKIGAFGLTEPDVGSGVAGGLTTTARRVKGAGEAGGGSWILDGQKKWIGNATFADYVIIWARSLEDGQVKGFVVERGTPGFETSKQQDKIALRVVQNAHITLDGVRVPEENRLQRARLLRPDRRGTAPDPGRRRLAGHRLRPRRLRARAGLCPPAPAVRPPDREFPARPGLAGENAVQRHVFGLPVRAAVGAAAGRPGRGPSFRAGKGVLHGPDAGSSRVGARAPRR